MKMTALVFAIGAALLASACQPAPAPQSTAVSPPPTAAAAGAASFHVDPLGDNDWNIQGCQTMLSRVGAPMNEGLLFAEDGVDDGAKGFIKINGQVLHVALVRGARTDGGPEVRTFADAAHTIEVIETTTLGAANEEADSVERNGTLAVTFGGATQTIPVEGGTAC